MICLSFQYTYIKTISIKLLRQFAANDRCSLILFYDGIGRCHPFQRNIFGCPLLFGQTLNRIKQHTCHRLMLGYVKQLAPFSH